MNFLLKRAALVLLSGLCLGSATPTLAETIAKPAPVAEAATTQALTIVDIASSTGTFNTLVAALKAAGLVETLSGEGPLTVFAPTDDAFNALPKGTVETLLKPENKDKLVEILTYHVESSNL